MAFLCRISPGPRLRWPSLQPDTRLLTQQRPARSAHQAMTEVAAVQPAGENGPQEGPADWKKQLNLPARDTRVQTEVSAGRVRFSC